MYIGPWQEFRLGRVLANLAHTEKQDYVASRALNRAGQSCIENGSDVGRLEDVESHFGSIRSEPVGLDATDLRYTSHNF